MQVTLPEDLKDDKYKRLERKVASLMLSSLPRGVRDELVAHRVQGVHQILFRLMVVFQPGGAQDRAQLLRQLDVSESSAGPAEAVIAIRRWYRLLQRAADLHIALPDESLQVRSLSNIVRKTADQHADFKFRVALAKTELQIDSRPSQANVMRFLQHLLAELEQLGGGSRKPASTTTSTSAGTAATTTTPTPSLKGCNRALTMRRRSQGLLPRPPRRHASGLEQMWDASMVRRATLLIPGRALREQTGACFVEANSTGLRTVRQGTRPVLQQGCHRRRLQRQQRPP